MGVGIPGELLLRQFGEHVKAAFGGVAYHVGSSLRAKDGWRDVDVRVLLDDEEYLRLYGDPEYPQQNAAWVSTVLAWSTFGRVLTGLPIDFQPQARTHANEKNDGPRSALIALYPPFVMPAPAQETER